MKICGSALALLSPSINDNKNGSLKVMVMNSEGQFKPVTTASPMECAQYGVQVNGLPNAPPGTPIFDKAART
jgi:hypothetical protein